MTDKWKLVPIEPTVEMKGKGAESIDIRPSEAKAVYKAMLNASPTPPNTVDKAAYDGAREDLAIWKKRALEAENKVKIYDQRIVDIGVIAMNPVKVKQPPNTITIPVGEYERLKKDAERLEHVDDLLYQIESWCKAYPLTIFTEPDWDEVNEKLGSTLLTRVSGSNMRHVVTGIQAIIDKARSEP